MVLRHESVRAYSESTGKRYLTPEGRFGICFDCGCRGFPPSSWRVDISVTSTDNSSYWPTNSTCSDTDCESISGSHICNRVESSGTSARTTCLWKGGRFTKAHCDEYKTLFGEVIPTYLIKYDVEVSVAYAPTYSTHIVWKVDIKFYNDKDAEGEETDESTDLWEIWQARVETRKDSTSPGEEDVFLQCDQTGFSITSTHMSGSYPPGHPDLYYSPVNGTYHNTWTPQYPLNEGYGLQARERYCDHSSAGTYPYSGGPPRELQVSLTAL